MKIQAPYVANLFEFASYKGVSEEELKNYLTEEHLDLCNENNAVTETEYLNVFDALQKAVSDENFGIHYGCFLNIKALGFIVQISLNASSIEQGVLVLRHYLQNTFPLVSLDGEVENGQYILRLSSKIKSKDLRRQILDFVFCFIFRELKLMLPNNVNPEIEVPNSNISEFSNFLNVPVRLGKGYIFTFESTVLTTEINRKKVKEIEILLPKYLQIIDKKEDGYKEFSLQVRNVILSMCNPELPSFEHVASQFAFSHRTIQRKLTEEGLSFRRITDNIKSELSIYLSKGHKMKTQDIAFLLGYSESSAYLHATNRWKTEMSL